MSRKRFKREEKKPKLKAGELGPKSRKTTVKVKRLHKLSKSKLSLKAWARTTLLSENPLSPEATETVSSWLENKGMNV